MRSVLRSALLDPMLFNRIVRVASSLTNCTVPNGPRRISQAWPGGTTSWTACAVWHGPCAWR